MKNVVVGLEEPKLRKYEIVELRTNKVIYSGTYGQCDGKWAKLRWSLAQKGAQIRNFYKMVETDKFITC